MNPGILSKDDKGEWNYKVINEWQLCPKCQGSGLMWNTSGWPVNYTSVSTAPSTCDVCCGRKIISKLSGMPPSYEPNTNNNGPESKD